MTRTHPQVERIFGSPSDDRRGRANALDYPKQTIKVVVPFAAAGVTDIVARVVFRSNRADHRPDHRHRQPPRCRRHHRVEQVVNAPADGYTLVMADPSGSLPANVTLYPGLKYHPIRDLTRSRSSAIPVPSSW